MIRGTSDSNEGFVDILQAGRADVDRRDELCESPSQPPSEGRALRVPIII